MNDKSPRERTATGGEKRVWGLTAVETAAASE